MEIAPRYTLLTLFILSFGTVEVIWKQHLAMGEKMAQNQHSPMDSRDGSASKKILNRCHIYSSRKSAATSMDADLWFVIGSLFSWFIIGGLFYFHIAPLGDQQSFSLLRRNF